MSKDMLHSLIDLIPEKDTETIYNVLIKFIPEDVALPDEINAIAEADNDIEKNGIVSHAKIDWD